jgi:protein TonB
VQRITLVVAILLHVALAVAATSVQEQKRKRRATTVAVVSEKKKAPKPEDKPKPPPPPPPAPKAAPKAAPEPKAEAAPEPAAEAPKVASSEAAEPMSSGLNLSNDGPGMDMGGPAKDPNAGRKDPNAADAKPKAVKPVVKTDGGQGGAQGEQACTEEPTKPEVISKVEIEYTDQARADGVEGKLKLRLTIGSSGDVTSVEVLASVNASLDAAAVATARQWRFKPAMRCGKPFAGGTFVIARTFELGD